MVPTSTRLRPQRPIDAGSEGSRTTVHLPTPYCNVESDERHAKSLSVLIQSSQLHGCQRGNLSRTLPVKEARKAFKLLFNMDNASRLQFTLSGTSRRPALELNMRCE
ncbi:hypothetical protein ABVK25_002176 [Lepraria finkii]|uniref:Uncharacterized protein n=1 Tax=Lepraria finkii TaxID=1340010 RepID=A0ABR4BIZ3_9LECA